jgi:hypothetical protein
MKPGPIHLRNGVYNFTPADQFVEFGEKNSLFITGHCLIWHSQAPNWFFTDSLGKNVSRDVLIARMKEHISSVVGRYKGRVKGWDVVNEAFPIGMPNPDLFVDDDGRLYFYYGCSNVNPIYGVELEPKTLNPVGKSVVLFNSNKGEKHHRN